MENIFYVGFILHFELKKIKLVRCSTVSKPNQVSPQQFVEQALKN